MAVEYQVIPVDFGQGLDLKTDPKAVQAGKFLRLENAVFTKPNRIEKRNGSSELPTAISDSSTLTNPKFVKDFNNQLIASANGKLLSLSDSDSAWIKSGNYTSLELSRQIVDQTTQTSGFCDVAVLGNYALYGWSSFGELIGIGSTGPISSKVYLSVVDQTTGNTIYTSAALSTVSVASYITPVRCITLGGTQLAIVYVKNDATALVMRLVTLSGGGVVTVGAELTITTSFVSNAATRACWDILQTSTGASLLYVSNPGGPASVTLANINTVGTVTGTVSIVDAARIEEGVHVAQTSNGNLWIYWTRAAGSPHLSGSLVYAVYTSALASVLGATTVTTLVAPFYVSNMIAVNNSATQQTLYYGIYVTTSSTPLYTDKTVYRTVTDAGVIGTETTYAFGVIPYSRPVTESSVVYAVFLYRGAEQSAPTQLYIGIQTQPTFFLLTIDTTQTIPVCVGRFGAGVSSTQAALYTVLGFMPSVTLGTGSKYLFSCGIEIQTLGQDNFFYGEYLGSLASTYGYAFDFASVNNYYGVNSGGVSILNGAMLGLYDGESFSEFGFHLSPEIVSVAASSAFAGGTITPGTYSYIAIYQWVDAQGNLHQSAPSLPKSVTVGVGDDSVIAIISSAYLSKKNGVSVALFRTENAGTIYYQVSDPVSLKSASPETSPTATITDFLDDPLIVGNNQAYTYPASAVLENSTPPPSMALVSHNNRLWFVDSEEPNVIWYTKTVQNLVGLSPSAFLINQIDKKFGPIVGIAEMDEKLVSLKQSGFAIQSGDGADDTGANSSLTPAQFIPSDVGCNNLRSIATTPDGIWFDSPNGLYILTRSLQVAYGGMEVEDYNSQTIASATLMPGKSQLRFLCTSGVTLVYDYIFKQWSTFTFTGNSATPWLGTYVYSTGTEILVEDSTLYTDNTVAFTMLAQTSWLHIGTLQGFQRVRRLIMLGDYSNGLSASHGVQISAAYDFSTTFEPAIAYLFGSASTTGRFQYRERLPRQKCDTVSLLIEEITSGSSLEYIDLTNIGFEAAVKRGVNKLGATQSVG